MAPIRERRPNEPFSIAIGQMVSGAESCDGRNFIISHSIGWITIFAYCFSLSIIVRILHYCKEDIENIENIENIPLDLRLSGKSGVG